MILLCIGVLLITLWWLNRPAKLVIVVSPVRCMSTAFLRIFQQAGFSVYNEPSFWAYNKINLFETTKDWFRESGTPQTWAESKALFVNNLLPTCVKEMAYTVHDVLLVDKELMKRPNTYFILLVRDPDSVLVSGYRQMKDVWEFDKVMGFRQLWEIHCGLTSLGRPVRVVDVNSLSEQTIRSLFSWVGIRFSPGFLHWQAVDEIAAARSWHDFKKPEFVKKWHGECLGSTGIRRMPVYSLNEIPSEIRGEFQQASREAQKYYRYLIK